MKPYSYSETDSRVDVGCCPGHDYPRCYRWSGRYSSRHSKRTDDKENKAAKRRRRHRDKYLLKIKTSEIE